MLTQDSAQQIVLLQKITKLEEQHPININLLQPFDDCLTAFVLSKLLDFIQFERVIYFTVETEKIPGTIPFFKLSSKNFRTN